MTNEAEGTPDALKRMWIGVVHPPRPRLWGCLSWRPSLSDGCPSVSARDRAVEASYNHPAMATFLNFQTNKNNDEHETLPPHAGERIRIVVRYNIPVKLLIQAPDAQFRRARARIRDPIRARRWPFSSVAASRIVRNASASSIATGVATYGQGSRPSIS